jgi:hypothetical protein
MAEYSHIHETKTTEPVMKPEVRAVSRIMLHICGTCTENNGLHFKSLTSGMTDTQLITGNTKRRRQQPVRPTELEEGHHMVQQRILAVQCLATYHANDRVSA